jgi:hypothetical protein
MPAARLDDLIGKVGALDMDEIRRSLDAVAPAEPRGPKAETT